MKKMKTGLMWLIAGIAVGVAVVKLGLIEKAQTLFKKK